MIDDFLARTDVLSDSELAEISFNQGYKQGKKDQLAHFIKDVDDSACYCSDPFPHKAKDHSAKNIAVISYDRIKQKLAKYAEALK